jgi:hypothetical protein
VLFAWERIKADPGTILATIIVGTLLMFLIQGIVSAMAGLLSGGTTRVATSAAGAGSMPVAMMLGPMYWAVMGVGRLSGFVVSSFFVAGLMRFSLRVARGEAYAFNDLFGGGPYFLSVLVANFVMSIAVGIGCLFLLVPGLILALGLSMTIPLIVDRRIGPIEALTESWRLTEGSKGAIAVYFLIGLGLSITGACACGVGLLLVVPVVYLAHMYIYLKLTGQPVARVGPAA